jgi:hypothetical protein
MSRPWKVGEWWLHRRYRVQPPLAVGELAGALRPAAGGDRPGQQAVVRSYQDPVARLHGDAAARGADPRVDHRDMNRGRQVRNGLREHSGAAAHVAGRHQVRDVDEADAGGYPGRDPVAGGDETVLDAVVGQEAEAVIVGHEG